jgi:hypothetical protein
MKSAPAITAASILTLLLLMPPDATAQVLREDLWVANGTVDVVAASDNTIYLGGGFDRIAPATGEAVAIDTQTGAVAQPYPMVSGSVDSTLGFAEVYVVAADGNGGWFLGGSFGSVRGQARMGLAQVDSSGNVTAWNPGTDGPVYALSVSAGVVYAGGNFNAVGGQPRKSLAAISATTGVVSAWDPQAGPIAHPTIEAIIVLGNTIYVGGNFTFIGQQTRNYIAALDAASGLATGWNPNADNRVYALTVRVEVFPTASTTVYAGGQFANIGGAARNFVAALDATGAATGAATAWNPAPNGIVRALNVNGPSVFVGGLFTSIGGQSRRNLALISGSGLASTTFDPSPDFSVLALTRAGNILYVGGTFTAIGGLPRRGLAQIDLLGFTVTAWDPSPNMGKINALAVAGTRLFAGGGFTGMGGVTRLGLAALDATTGSATSWDPGPQVGRVRAFAIGDGILYAGGTFTSIAGQPRNMLAAIDRTTGAVTGWSPGVFGGVTVSTLLFRPSGPGAGTVYIGGLFPFVGGFARNNIAAADAVTGNLASWDPNADGWVHALAASGDTIYAGGEFAHIGGQSRNALAALDGSTGTATTWSPIPDLQSPARGVDALAVVGGNVHAGGNYSLSGQPRYLAAFDRSTGALAPTSATANNRVLSIMASGRTVYVGGDFSQVSGQPQHNLGAYDADTGVGFLWDPRMFGRVYSIALAGGSVFAGGVFYRPSGTPHSNIVGFSQPLVGVEPGLLSAMSIRAVPNPSRGVVALDFTAAQSGEAQASLFDLSGRLVRTLERGRLLAGPNRLLWNGRDDAGRTVPPGLYLVRVVGRTGERSGKVLRLE